MSLLKLVGLYPACRTIRKTYLMKESSKKGKSAMPNRRFHDG